MLHHRCVNTFHKTRLFMLLFTLSMAVLGFGQEQGESKKINCSADVLRYDASVNPDIQILTGNVVFTHEGAICYADTAFYNEKTNVIEAFGEELIIHINDTVHLYGKYLMYDGRTKIVFIERDVILSDEYSVLYTDRLTYLRNEAYAYYDTHGTIVDDSNTLDSEQGWYYTETKDVYFKENVVLVSPDYTVETDTLRYNTQSKIAYFLCPTYIFSDDNSIYCEDGWYDTEQDIYQFEKNVRINTPDQCMQGEYIWYDKIHDIGIAKKNISVYDSVENVLILGEYAEYYGQEGFTFITDSAIAVLIDGKDSLFMHSDTIWANFDSAQNVSEVLAYHQVRFYRYDLQGSCDSLVYWAKDSIINMFRSPVIWFEKNQCLADTVRLFIRNREIHEMHLIRNSFICEDVFKENKFNQIQGRNMFVYFLNNAIDYVFVDADAECLYYVLDEQKALIGINQSVSKQMRIDFADNEVSLITLYKTVKGDMSPEKDKSNVFLRDFIWLNQYRPKSKEDIFMPAFYKPELKIELTEEEEE